MLSGRIGIRRITEGWIGPALPPEIIGISADNRLMTVHFERDAAGGEFALLDRTTGEVHSLFQQRKAFAGLALRAMTPVVIEARDGLKLNSYLTLPGAGTDGAAGPRWPYARGHWGFKPVHQWPAGRGYAVLSVNCRGSTGFGKAFVTAADREWGGRMHDDLIDAVEWAVGQGIADPSGSASSARAMAALSTCTASPICEPSWRRFRRTGGPLLSIWRTRLADPGTEEGRAFLAERSPINHIDRAMRPILIAQGMQDVRVVAAESEQVVTALQKRGVPVTYVTFRDEGHGFVRPENRLAFYAVAEAFLAKHLGGRAQPFGTDFTGSTLKVEAGSELVPGLPP